MSEHSVILVLQSVVQGSNEDVQTWVGVYIFDDYISIFPNWQVAVHNIASGNVVKEKWGEKSFNKLWQIYINISMEKPPQLK